MSQSPVPPGLDRAGGRHRRPRRRVQFLAALTALVVLAGVGAWLLIADRPDDGTSAAAPGEGRTGTDALRDCGRAGRTKVPLTILTSPDKQAALTALAEDFATGSRDERGRCIEVSIVSRPSGVALTQLSADWDPSNGAAPAIWAPSSSTWLTLLQERLATAGRPTILPVGTPARSVASSPTVIALPRPMAQALGWPAKHPGLADLLAIGTDPRGWGAVGHAEWGRVRIGRTDPTVSDQGLDATIAATYAATRQTRELTPAAIGSRSDLTFLGNLDRATFRYEADLAPFAALWSAAGARAPAVMSALLTDEHWVAEYNSAASGAPAIPLVAAYPPTGSVFADHPAAILDAPWTSDAGRDAAQAFTDYLVSADASDAWQAQHFRTPDHRLFPGDASLGLDPKQPTVVLPRPSPEATQALLKAWQQLAVQANVLFVVDTSGSMATPIAGSRTRVTKIQAATSAAAAAMGLFSERARVGLWSFAGGRRGEIDHRELVAPGPVGELVAGVPRRQAITAALKELRPRGDTGLYNTVLAARRAMAIQADREHVTIVIVVTDGRNDAEGGATLTDVLGELRSQPQDARVRFFTVAFGPDADQRTLAQIADASGGSALVAPRTEDLPAVFAAALTARR